MGSYCSLRAGGRAAGLITLQTREELTGLLRQLRDLHLEYLLLGRGSNILVRPQGYSGIVIRLQGEFTEIESLPSGSNSADRPLIRVGAGCSLAALLAWCGRNGYGGLEFLAGIPGSVGGAVYMNAGAWGEAVGDYLAAIEFVDEQGGVQRLGRQDMVFSYRQTALKTGLLGKCVFLSATFYVERVAGDKVRRRCQEYIAQRKTRQPGGVASAGSFFENPANDFAGRLIEAAGLKGARYGKAMVSPVHANFIVNTGGASAEDILGLMEYVQKEVTKQFNIQLKPEVQII